MVAHYGDWQAEHHALTSTVGVVDLSARGRLVLLGADRQKMLNGQVTNNVLTLRPGQGCYAALVDAKARMLSDLNIYALADELLLDFEPGLSATVAARLEKFIISDDVQVIDASPHYGLLSLQGRKAGAIVDALGLVPTPPRGAGEIAFANDAVHGQLYLAHQPRCGERGVDLFAPVGSLPALWEALVSQARAIGGRPVGAQALEVARVEAGIPRYGADMDATNLPPEAGIAERAISYTKGCYSGQEVIARIRTYGQVAKALRGLRLSVSDPGAASPSRGTRLFRAGKDVGYVTSAVWSPAVGTQIALGYVRRECHQPGVELAVGGPESETRATIVPLPFAGGLQIAARE